MAAYYGAKHYVDGKLKSTLLHRLIWEQKKGPIPKGFIVHHKDGNKKNNCLDNLECLSQSEHTKKHPLSPETYNKTCAFARRFNSKEYKLNLSQR